MGPQGATGPQGPSGNAGVYAEVTIPPGVNQALLGVPGFGTSKADVHPVR